MESSLLRLDKHLWPIGAAIATLLTGGWLMLAPFALGYQDYGADWAPETVNQFWLGLGVVLLSAIALAVFIWRLVSELRAARVFPSRHAEQPPRHPEPSGPPRGQPMPREWSAAAQPPAQPPRPAYVPPQPAAPWGTAAPAQRPPVPSQPAPYAESWPPQPAQPEWQAQPRPAPARVPSPSETTSASPAPPYPGWPPQPSAPPVPAEAYPQGAPPQGAPPASAQAASAQALHPQGAAAGPPEESAVPEIPPWLRPAAPASGQHSGESLNAPTSEFDRAMAMLAQSLARDLAARQQATAPAGERGPAPPPEQQGNQANPPAPQQEALR